MPASRAKTHRSEQKAKRLRPERDEGGALGVVCVCARALGIVCGWGAMWVRTRTRAPPWALCVCVCVFVCVCVCVHLCSCLSARVFSIPPCHFVSVDMYVSVCGLGGLNESVYMVYLYEKIFKCKYVCVCV